MSYSLLILPILLASYMYWVRSYNAQRFCEALERRGAETGGVFSGVTYAGEYAGREFAFVKYGKITLLYLKTTLPKADNGLSYIVFPYGWKKIASGIAFFEGKLFYSGFDRGGFSFFLYPYTINDFTKIFGRLIEAAKLVESQPR